MALALKLTLGINFTTTGNLIGAVLDEYSAIASFPY
jgi:hypothetical protein